MGRVSFTLASLNKRCSSRLLKLFAEQMANLFLSVSPWSRPGHFFCVMIVGHHRKAICGLAALANVAGWSSWVKQGSLWSVREMVPSQSSTHVCSAVINCPLHPRPRPKKEEMLYYFSYCVSERVELAWVEFWPKKFDRRLTKAVYSKPAPLPRSCISKRRPLLLWVLFCFKLFN